MTGGQRLNILVLYNDAWTHIGSTREHLAAFTNHSRHNYMFMPAQAMVAAKDVGRRLFDDYREAWPSAWDFSLYDAVIWHWVLPAYKTAATWSQDYIAEAVIERLGAYDGLKIMFAQDEYESTATTWDSIRRAGIHLVMTGVPRDGWSYVYPPEELPGVEFEPTLFGYVADNLDLDRFAIPMDQRRLRLGYRGRALPFRYGDLTREKYEIGVKARAFADAQGVPVDIDWTEGARIYGDDWYRFLGSARATLMTETGSNVVDFHGALRATEAQAEGLTYEEYHARYLADLDGRIRMQQPPPKIFEAIALRTALVCFEGVYGGVVQPERHYIELKKDFSNIAEVFARLEDVEALKAMAERAYDEVIASGRWGYREMMSKFDDLIDRKLPGPPRAEIVSAPILIRRCDGPYEPIVRSAPLEYLLNDTILHGRFQRRDLEDAMARVRAAESSPRREPSDTPPADARVAFSADAEAVRCYEYWANAGANVALEAGGARVTTPPAPWHYAAGVHLDFSSVNLAHEHAWVALTLADAGPNLQAGLYDAEADVLFPETRIPAAADQQTVWLKVPHGKANLLLLRTGEEPKRATGVVIKVEVLAASVYTPAFLDLARRLAELPKDERPW